MEATPPFPFDAQESSALMSSYLRIWLRVKLTTLPPGPVSLLRKPTCGVRLCLYSLVSTLPLLPARAWHAVGAHSSLPKGTPADGALVWMGAGTCQAARERPPWHRPGAPPPFPPSGPHQGRKRDPASPDSLSFTLQPQKRVRFVASIPWNAQKVLSSQMNINMILNAWFSWVVRKAHIWSSHC